MKNICCGYSLEVPWQGTSNEYPQHVFMEKFMAMDHKPELNPIRDDFTGLHCMESYPITFPAS